jgi:hypothetical protein
MNMKIYMFFKKINREKEWDSYKTEVVSYYERWEIVIKLIKKWSSY